MANQRREPEELLYDVADPPDVQAAKMDALRACLKKELPPLVREAVREEMQVQRRREAVPEMLSRGEAADTLTISTRLLSTLTTIADLLLCAFDA